MSSAPPNSGDWRKIWCSGGDGHCISHVNTHTSASKSQFIYIYFLMVFFSSLPLFFLPFFLFSKTCCSTERFDRKRSRTQSSRFPSPPTRASSPFTQGRHWMIWMTSIHSLSHGLTNIRSKTPTIFFPLVENCIVFLMFFLQTLASRVQACACACAFIIRPCLSYECCPSAYLEMSH